MLKYYIKIAWRNLTRNKGFSITNLLGLTIGMTCTILILLWVQDELSFNRFNENYKDIYQVIANRDFKNQMFTDRSMILPLASALEKAYPQVKNAVVTTWGDGNVLSVGEKKLSKNGLTASEHFFDLFTWKTIEGAPEKALTDASNIVITASTAKALFGNAAALNRVIRIDNEQNARVAAVVADPPRNSSIQFDYVRPFDYADSNVKKSMNEWNSSSWLVYVQPQPGTNLEQLTKNVNALKRERSKGDKSSTYFLFPMNRWRLYSEFKDGKNTGGMIEYVRLFSIIALIILITACVNFMNLSTARSEKRAKEVGIRKTLGSQKGQLILQFFLESIILACIAFLLSILAVYLLLPSFNLLVDKNLAFDLTQPFYLCISIAIVLFTGLVAGSYPALYLSSFNPVKTLKGTFLAGKKAALPRHILVVGQFVISILLISATIIVYQQIQYVKNRDMGYNPNNLISVPSSRDINNNYAAIKNDLIKTGLVQAVTRTGSPITQIQWRSGGPDYDGKPAGTFIIMSCLSTDADLVKTMGIKMIDGKDFSGIPGDSLSIILNKKAVDVMHLTHPLGMELRYGNSKYHVIGITENVVIENPFEPVDPTMIFYDRSGSQYVSLRLAANVAPQQALSSIETIFKKYNPAFPFEYQFVDKEFGKKFLTEELISKITVIFAGLAIFICCIGLAGLATFTIEKRIREIGIRKVLGSSIQQILLLISTQFLKLAAIAFLIAVPLTWLLMRHWLNTYAFHTSISIWLFGSVGILILLLTLVVVSLNTIRVATSNPIDSLRSE